MPLQSVVRQIGSAFVGFALGGFAMFWLPWLVALLFGDFSGLGLGGLARLFGIHLVAALLLAGAYALLFAVHMMLRPSARESRPLRLHFFTGLMGVGLFYLLLPLTFFQNHPLVLVVLVVAAVLLIQFIWEQRHKSSEKPFWLR